MAPGRRRASKGVRPPGTGGSLSTGDLVLAKVKGFPAWPAKISKPEDWKRAPDPRKYFVQFYGTEEIAFVAPADIQVFTTEAKNKLLSRCRGKTVKHFAQAITEICEEFEQLQQKSSSFSEDAPGSGRHIIDGVIAVETNSEDRNGKEGIQEQIENISLGDHSSGLGRCSQGKGEIEDNSIKTGASEDENEGSLKRNKSLTDDSNVLKEELSTSSSNSESSGMGSSHDRMDESSLKKLNHRRSKGSDNRHVRASEDESASLLPSDNQKYPGDSQDLVNDRPVQDTGSKGKGDSSRMPSIDARVGRNVGLNKSISRVDQSVSNQKSRIQKKNAVHGQDSSQADGGRKVNKLLKDKKDSEKKVKPQLGAELSSVKDKAGLSGKRQEERKQLNNKILDSTKRVADGSRKIKSQGEDDKVTHLVNERSASRGKAENRLGIKSSATIIGSNLSSDEDVLPPSKRRRRALEAMSTSSALSSENRIGSSAAAKIGSKRRRAVRLFDDDEEEEPKTPIHESSTKKVVVTLHHQSSSKEIDMHGSVSNHLGKRSSGTSDNRSPKKLVPSEEKPVAYLSPKSQPMEKVQSKSLGSLLSPGKVDAEKVLSKEAKGALVSQQMEKVLSKSLGSLRSPVKVDAEKFHIREAKQATISQRMEKLRGKPLGYRLSPGKEDAKKILSKETKQAPGLQQIEKAQNKTLGSRLSPGKVDAETFLSKEDKQAPVSPGRSLLSAPTKSPVEARKPYKLSDKFSGNIYMKKTPLPHKTPVPTSDSLNTPVNQLNERSKLDSSAEISKGTPKLHSKTSDLTVSTGFVESHSLQGERSQAGREEKLTAVDQKADSSTSIRHLIAAAQAKRRQAHLHNLNGHSDSLMAPNIDAPVRSLSPAPVTQPMGSSNIAPLDKLVLLPNSLAASPRSDAYKSTSTNPHGSDEFVERRVSSEHQTAGPSLSGVTEAAVARDAFEGMIETLSRTKESIGRATRHAIDCAKYGIANEIVHLLIRKLGSEPSSHRKVDLLFLVDSITQCSHSHKGIAGASYIPAVQDGLHRLLSVAAPPGPAGRENRRQCLKVLRLWLERKIMPEYLLRRCIDEIGANDDTSSGFSLRRPARAERAIDDPIREMEGMEVDEYGSNATFPLPGLFSSHLFRDEEEEEGEEEELGILNSSAKEVAAVSPSGHSPAEGEFENDAVTPSARRHHILEDVDGELEMEDVSGHQKFERPWRTTDAYDIGASHSDSINVLESTLIIPCELPPLPEESPPVPLGSPPATPPLPSSLPSSPLLPPPPLSSVLPPPPPPSLQPEQIPPPPIGPPPILPPQPSMVVQHAHTISSSSLASVASYQQPLRPPEIGGNGNSSHGLTDASVRTMSLEYGRPLGFQPSIQFQTGSAPFAQRPMLPNLPQQNTPNHFSYPIPPVRQHPPPPVQLPSPAIQPPLPPPTYPTPYSHSHVPRQFVSDEQWRLRPPKDYNADHQHGMWMPGVGPSGPAYLQDGYHMPPNVGTASFRPSAPNSFPSGTPVQGHSDTHRIPSRQDISAFSWRPA